MLTQADEQAIAHLLRQFRFGRVRQAMLATGQRWQHYRPDGQEQRYTPSTEQLRDAAERLLLLLAESGRVWAHEGGFTAVHLGASWQLAWEVELALHEGA